MKSKQLKITFLGQKNATKKKKYKERGLPFPVDVGLGKGDVGGGSGVALHCHCLFLLFLRFPAKISNPVPRNRRRVPAVFEIPKTLEKKKEKNKTSGDD